MLFPRKREPIIPNIRRSPHARGKQYSESMDLDLDITIDDERWESLETPDARDVLSAAIHASNKTAFHDSAEISLVLTNDKEIRKLNKMYRGKDKATNVLSFPLIDFTDGSFKDPHGNALGDIIIALETVETEAQMQNKPLHDHITHLLVHGTLHLLGYDHEEDQEAEEMEALEIKILEGFDIKNPYGDDFFVAQLEA